MRRTGSSSCLLKPKKSLSQHDLAVLHDKAPTATVLTVNRLPPYVTDRLYMLSELQVHAHSLQFLCDLKKNGTKPSLPASIILYLRWKPDTYPTPISFADGPLSECVRQCLIANGDDAPFDELQFVRSKPREQPYSPRRQHYDELPAKTVESLKKISIPLPVLGADGLSVSKSTDTIETKHDEENENKQMTNIYVVVDRISPESNSGDLPDLPDLSCASYESIRRGERPTLLHSALDPSSGTVIWHHSGKAGCSVAMPSVLFSSLATARADATCQKRCRRACTVQTPLHCAHRPHTPDIPSWLKIVWPPLLRIS